MSSTKPTTTPSQQFLIAGSSIPETAIEHSGWLFQRSIYTKAFKKRWFILIGRLLVFYKNKYARATGVYDLRNYSFVEREDALVNPTSFSQIKLARSFFIVLRDIDIHSLRTKIYVRADTIELADIWILKLRLQLYRIQLQQRLIAYQLPHNYDRYNVNNYNRFIKLELTQLNTSTIHTLNNCATDLFIQLPGFISQVITLCLVNNRLQLLLPNEIWWLIFDLLYKYEVVKPLILTLFHNKNNKGNSNSMLNAANIDMIGMSNSAIGKWNCAQSFISNVAK